MPTRSFGRRSTSFVCSWGRKKIERAELAELAAADRSSGEFQIATDRRQCFLGRRYTATELNWLVLVAFE